MGRPNCGGLKKRKPRPFDRGLPVIAGSHSRCRQMALWKDTKYLILCGVTVAKSFRPDYWRVDNTTTKFARQLRGLSSVAASRGDAQGKNGRCEAESACDEIERRKRCNRKAANSSNCLMLLFSKFLRQRLHFSPNRSSVRSSSYDSGSWIICSARRGNRTFNNGGH
jgi:hypothetical protein